MSLNSWLTDKIHEVSASKDLNLKMWKEDLTDHEFSILSDDDKKWILNYLNKDSTFKAYSEAEREKCLNLIYEIESSVPIISDSGKTMPPCHRLYIAFEIAKPLLRRSQSILKILSSIVVYPGSKIRKEYQEGGLLLSKGYNSHHARFSALVQSLNAIGSYTSWNELILGKSFKKTVKELSQWQKKLSLIHDEKKREQFFSFLKIARDEIKKDFLPNFKEFSLNIKDSETKKLFSSFSSSTLEVFDLLINSEDQITEENQVSIHFSWISHLTYMTTKQGNLIVHELAHALDFEYSGLDGIPSTDLVDQSSIAKDWTSFFEEAQDQSKKSSILNFLNPYGLTNSYEFFAVCSEHYFREPSVVKENAPSLFLALEKIYGTAQGDVKKWSPLKFLKNLCFSKINGNFN